MGADAGQELCKPAVSHVEGLQEWLRNRGFGWTCSRHLVALYRDPLIADPDVDAAAAFLIVKIAQNSETDEEQADEEVKRIAVHGAVLSCGQSAVSSACLFGIHSHPLIPMPFRGELRLCEAIA